MPQHLKKDACLAFTRAKRVFPASPSVGADITGKITARTDHDKHLEGVLLFSFEYA